MEVYNTPDTILHNQRNGVFHELIRQFENSKNPAEMAKVESLLFAVLKNNKMSNVLILDQYLANKSEAFKNSVQRKMIINKRDEFYKGLKNKNEENYKWISKYFNEVRVYLNSIKQLSNYTPPIVID